MMTTEVPAQLPGKVGEEVRREKRSRQKRRKGKRERGRGEVCDQFE